MEVSKPGNSKARRTLHLHIGIPKTATTWLQQDVFPLLDHLYYVGCPENRLFQQPEDLTDQRLMASTLKRSSQVWTGFGDAIFEQLVGDRQAWLAGGQDLLISEEGIGRQASRPALLGAHLHEMRQKALEWGFDRLKVVCIIRRQDHWLASHYAQMSDRNPNAGQADFERLVNEVTSASLGRYGFGMLLDFCTITDHLENAVGDDGLTTLPYELLKTSPRAFLFQLLGSLNTPSHKIREIVERTPGTAANVRSEKGIWRLRPRSARQIAGVRLPNWSWGRGNHTIELTPALVKKICDAYSAGNHALAANKGIDLEEHGYFDFSTGNS